MERYGRVYIDNGLQPNPFMESHTKGDVQEASKDNNKGEKGAKVEHKRVLENYLPQHNTGWTDAGEINGS